MNLKNKIAAAALCALIAGVGIFGVGGNNALATPGSINPATMTIDQMQQMIQSLMQQIQQITQLIAQLKPQETCGNGICRFGETAATCAANCGAIVCANESETISPRSNKECCPGLSAAHGSLSNGSCITPPGGFRVCIKKDDGICGARENICNSPADCGTTSICGKTNLTAASKNSCASSGGELLCTACSYASHTPGSACINTCTCNCANACVTEGMIFTGTAKQCCSGLEKVLSNGQQACQIGASCPNNPNYTCQRMQTEITTPACNQTCKNKGYSGSYCGSSGGGLLEHGSDVPSACGGSWINAGETNDCNGNNMLDAGQTCCCGGTIYPICGNGACETGETAGNCITDCGKTCQQGCADAGYANGGTCRSWTRESTVRGCLSGETSNGPSAKECNMFGLPDGTYKACCCSGSNGLPAVQM